MVITGLGAVTPLGLNVEEYWEGLVKGRCAIGPITLFDASRYPVKLAAEVKGFDPADFMPLKRADRAARCTHFAIAAASMAVTSARLDMSRETPERVGIVIATTGMMDLLAEQGQVLRERGPMRVDPLFISKIAPSMVPAQVGLELGAKGPNCSLNSACASGSDALGAALNYLRLGHADVMIAGGAEAPITAITVAATARVGALSRETDPSRACLPFDLNRNGFVFGEGAGMLVLETLEHALSRDAPVLAELAGSGWSFDAFSETAPDADLQAASMRMALRDAGVSPEEVDYLNAHGSGTRLNDATETRAVKMVFGERACRLPISSNKAAAGHLACAAGAVEAIATVMTISRGIIPPTINYRTPDPECDLDYVVEGPRRQPVNVCLSNSFGMGGQNCSLVIRRA